MATFSMPALPRLGKSSGAVHACVCGCGKGTRRTWHPGHDGRANGWAVRIEKGILSLDEVPENERAGALIMLQRHKAENEAIERKTKVG